MRTAGLTAAALALTASLPPLPPVHADTARTAAAAVHAELGLSALAPAARPPLRLPPPPRVRHITRTAAAAAAAAAGTAVRKTTAATSGTVKKTTTAHTKPAVLKKPAAKPGAKSAKPGAKPASAVQAAGGIGRAETAVRFALAQVGKPYVWGAAGPGSYDCSGLVMAAFAKIGVKLAHQSGSIAGSGRSVSRSQLQRGDVILYSGHVAIALGGGMMVHAANPRTGIVVAKIYGSPIGYRRMV